jgi:hypothetical protein
VQLKTPTENGANPAIALLDYFFGCSNKITSLPATSFGVKTAGMRTCHLILFALAFVITGCGQSPAPIESANGNEELSKRVAVLENRPVSAPIVPQNNTQLTERLAQLENGFNSLSNQVRQDEWQTASKQNQFRFTAIAPDDKGYGKLETDLGTLFVSTESVDPYLDGYKIHLNIGNPSYATFSDFKLIASWGPLLTNFDDWDKWSASQNQNKRCYHNATCRRMEFS